MEMIVLLLVLGSWWNEILRDYISVDLNRAQRENLVWLVNVDDEQMKSLETYEIVIVIERISRAINLEW